MNEFKQISERLQHIARYIKSEMTFADIGSDHAYLPSYICMKDPTVTAIAGEVSKGPFDRAKQTVIEHGLVERIDVRLGDGLAVISETEKIDAIVIAGMGGGLISNILKDGQKKLKNITRIIAQPNTNGYIVRKTVQALGYALISEEIIEENDHIYEIIVAEKPSNDFQLLDEKSLLFGPFLLEEKSDVLKKKWSLEKQKMQYVLTQMKKSDQIDEEKITSYERTLQWIEEEIF